MLGDDRRQVLVDRAGRLLAVLRIERVHELERRAGDRLDIDAHLVHVGEPLLDRRETGEHVLHLLLVCRPRQLVGEARRRLVLRAVDALYHLVGGRVADVAMKVDAEMTAAASGLSRATAPCCRTWTREEPDSLR